MAVGVQWVIEFAQLVVLSNDVSNGMGLPLLFCYMYAFSYNATKMNITLFLCHTNEM